MIKKLKWNAELKIIDLYGIPGATAELRSYTQSYARNREIENYCEVVIRFKNDKISIEKCISLIRRKLDCLNKVQGKQAGIKKLTDNRFYYMDMMRAESMKEIEDIRQATIFKNILPKLYLEQNELLKKKSDYEEDYQKQEKKYRHDCEHINEPIGWNDKKIGSRIVGKTTQYVERVVGYTEACYRALPDKEPRSSFESPDYEMIYNSYPIYKSVPETVNVYEDITAKEPILRKPIMPKMDSNYSEILKNIDDVSSKIKIGELRQQYILNNMEKY